MGIPNEFSSNYIDKGYDSLVFEDLENPQRVLKYYNHPNVTNNGRKLSLKEIEKYHLIHQRYAKIGIIPGTAVYGGEKQLSVSILDLGDDIHYLSDNKIIIARVPKVQGNHCLMISVIMAVENLLSDAGIPIEIRDDKKEGHFLSPKNVLYTEKGDDKLDIVITNLGACIRESLQIERRLLKLK